MVKQTVIGLTFFLTGLVAGLVAVGHSQPYLGGSIGRTWQHGIGDRPALPDYSACASLTNVQYSDTLTAFAGYRFKYIGAEVGGGKLFSSKFGGTCPWAAGYQTITASHNYARVNAYIPLVDGMELVPFFGAAKVKHTNHEEFDTTYGEGHLVNHSTGTTVSPLYGIGVQKAFGGNWFVRFEVQHMERVAEDYWTARGFHNSLDSVKFAVGFNWGS